MRNFFNFFQQDLHKIDDSILGKFTKEVDLLINQHTNDNNNAKFAEDPIIQSLNRWMNIPLVDLINGYLKNENLENISIDFILNRIQLHSLLLNNSIETNNAIAKLILDLEKQTQKNQETTFLSKAYLILGSVYHFGCIVNKNHKNAIHYYRMAIKLKNTMAENNLGLLYNEHSKKQKAIACFLNGQNEENSSSNINLGLLSLEQTDEEQRFLHAKSYFEHAASLKNRYALTQLGLLLVQGLGLKKNPKKAKTFFTYAAILGDPIALMELAKIICQEAELKKEYTEAPEQFKEINKSFKQAEDYARTAALYGGIKVWQDLAALYHPKGFAHSMPKHTEAAYFYRLLFILEKKKVYADKLSNLINLEEKIDRHQVPILYYLAMTKHDIFLLKKAFFIDFEKTKQLWIKDKDHPLTKEQVLQVMSIYIENEDMLYKMIREELKSPSILPHYHQTFDERKHERKRHYRAQHRRHHLFTNNINTTFSQSDIKQNSINEKELPLLTLKK